MIDVCCAPNSMFAQEYAKPLEWTIAHANASLLEYVA